jgi:hypothetical protein
MPSKLDPQVGLIASWLAAEPQLTAIAMLREYENVAQPQGLWTARAIQGPTRPQPLFLYQSSTLIHQPMSSGHPPGNILR